MPAYSAAVKRRADTHPSTLERAEMRTEMRGGPDPAHPGPGPAETDLEEGPLVLATAFTATAAFHSPPKHVLPTQASLVEGLLRQFKVVEPEGPLPVVSKCDPKAIPSTLQQAMKSPYARYWAEATISEWLSIIGNDTWVLVDHEPWMKVIPCKWVYTIKTDADGIPTRFKARLVAGGHMSCD